MSFQVKDALERPLRPLLPLLGGLSKEPFPETSLTVHSVDIRCQDLTVLMYTFQTNQLTKPMSRVHICTFYDHGTGEMKPFNHLHRIHQMMN